MITTMKESTTKEMTPVQKQEVQGAESTRPGPVFTPAADIYETETGITVLADMPGVAADGLDIGLHDSVLTIEGRVTAPEAKGHEIYREYDGGGLYRREFRLTNLIDQSGIRATLRDGVLRLTLPKAEAARPRRIEVRAG